MFSSFLLLLFAQVAQASFGYDLPPMLGYQGQESTVLRYMEMAEPKQSSSTTNNQTGIEQHNFLFSTPLANTDKNSWSVYEKTQWMDIHSNAVLPSGLAIPNTLWDIHLGVSFTHQLGNEKSWGVSTSFGSASDKPFSRFQDDTINVNANYAFAESKQSHWLLLLNYSNNRTFLNNIPIPSFAYIYTPNQSFTGIFGLPFVILNWRPSDSAWAFNAAMYFFHFGKLEADYSPWKMVSIFAALEAGEESFLRDNRVNLADRLTYLEDRALLGIKAPLSSLIFAEMSGGYSFKRSFYEVQNYGDRSSNTVAVASGPIITATITARF